jgi:hypothetical protein
MAEVHPRALTVVRIDVLDDGSELVAFTICRGCALEFGRTDGDVLPGDDFDNEKALPWVAPSCGLCFERWVGPAAPGEGG